MVSFVELPYLYNLSNDLHADMWSAQALQHGVNEADSSEEDEGEPAEPTYVQEQQDLKRNFLQVCNHVLPGK